MSKRRVLITFFTHYTDHAGHTWFFPSTPLTCSNYPIQLNQCFTFSSLAYFPLPFLPLWPLDSTYLFTEPTPSLHYPPHSLLCHFPSVVVLRQWPKATWEDRVYLAYLRNVRAGTQAGTEEGPESLGLFSLHSHMTQDHLPRVGTVHIGLGPLKPIINQGNVSKTRPHANLMEANPQVKFPDDSSFCQLDKN